MKRWPAGRTTTLRSTSSPELRTKNGTRTPGLVSSLYSNGSWSVIGGRLIPLTALEDPGKLVGSLTSAVGFVDALAILIVAGRGVRERDVDSRQTSVHSSWRQAFIHTGFTAVWGADAPQSGITAKTNGLFSAIDVLSKEYPEAGEYFNEAYLETDWQEAFWGAQNYERLLMVKK